jgi:hypothetical protein
LYNTPSDQNHYISWKNDGSRVVKARREACFERSTKPLSKLDTKDLQDAKALLDELAGSAID